MSRFSEYLEASKIKRGSVGLTDFKIVGDTITITHSGNMGNRIADVIKNAKTYFGGFDIFSTDQYKKISESGSPDYFYKVVFKAIKK